MTFLLSSLAAWPLKKFMVLTLMNVHLPDDVVLENIAEVDTVLEPPEDLYLLPETEGSEYLTVGLK